MAKIGDVCTALGGEAFSTLKRRSPAMPGFVMEGISMLTQYHSMNCNHP
jgi:hypothetical protein